MRKIQEPTVSKETRGGEEYEVLRHPAFGQVSITHVSGRANLYGSDFEHHHYVTLTIKRSELHRNLSRDWNFERELVTEIALSEAQFATMISSPNRSGVPCTFLHTEHEVVPSLPRRDTKKLYDAELEKKLKKSVAELEAHRDEIRTAVVKLPKKVQEQVLGPIERAITELKSNTPFVIKSFGEHMEESVERAKSEINAYVTNTVMRAGLTALQSGDPVLEIADKSEEK